MTGIVVEKGLLAQTLPFVRLGGGPRKLVVFPGLADALMDVSRRGWVVPSHYQRFTDDFTVYIISRRRRLPAGYTTREMAADYARAFENAIGPAVVMGISLGGYVAQHFAVDFPQYVERLVIACAAHRVSDKGREIPERWLALAQQNRWREFYCDVAKVSMREYRKTVHRSLLPLTRMRLANLTDFLVSLKACLTHDGSELLSRIRAPTLVIGGSEDSFFPSTLLSEMARRIPAATLRLLDGGHDAHELRRDEFEGAVMQFLQGLRVHNVQTNEAIVGGAERQEIAGLNGLKH